MSSHQKSIFFVVLLISALLALYSIQQSEAARVYIHRSHLDKAIQGGHFRHDDVAFHMAQHVSIDLHPNVLERLQKTHGIQYESVGTYSAQGMVEKFAKVSSLATGPTDKTPWGIEATYGNVSIAGTSGGEDVIVAVLDSGIVPHRDLPTPQRCVSYCGKSGCTKRVEGTCVDGLGHGTHATGTILANGSHGGIWGVAPGATLHTYKVLDDEGNGSYDILALAIHEAVDHGANIISMSLGGSARDDNLKEAIDYATRNNVLVVCAAGNSGPYLNTIMYPAAYTGAVAVAALQRPNARASSQSTLSVASYSSRGVNAKGFDGTKEKEVEVSGPGSSIESTSKTGGYEVMSGTSMATPHIAGLAAKFWKQNGGSAEQTRLWLQTQAKKRDITSGTFARAGYDPAAGLGQPRVI